MDEQPFSLSNFVGETLMAKIPAFRDGAIITIKLLGVEHAGIWIESSDLMEDMLKGTTHTMTAKTVVVFLPYAQILAIYHLKDSPWISRKLTG
jgi:hypothetical protein